MLLRSTSLVAVLFAVVTLSLPAQDASRLGSFAAVRPVDADQRGVTVEITGLRPVVQAPTGKSGGGLSLNAPQYLFKADTNAQPEMRFILGIPHGATNLKAEILNSNPQQTTLKLPSLLPPTDRPVVEVIRGGDMRGINTAILAWRPVRYDGSIVSYAAAARIRVSWEMPGGVLSSSKESYKEIPAIEQGLKSSILNYDQARSWKSSEKKNRDGATQLSSGSVGPSGWGIGEEALLLSVPQTGVYRLSGAEFAAATGSGPVSIANLRLNNRKVPVPFFITDGGASGQFDVGDVLEFRGDRNPGEPGIYLNEITDTNVYVLTWSGGAGEPPTVKGSEKPVYKSIAESYDSTIHVEDEVYWFGGLRLFDGDEKTLFVSERVQQERFYWRVATRTRTDPLEFDCSPHYEQDAQVTMSIRIAGGVYMPIQQFEPAHTITQTLKIFVNGLDVGTISIQDTNEIFVPVTFPANRLVNGTNKVWFDLIALDTNYAGTKITNDIRVDYLELKGRWKPFSNGAPVALPQSTGENVGIAVAGMAQQPDLTIISGASLGADSVQRGHLYRLTSRNTVETRTNPGFYATAGGEQITSPGVFNLGITIAEVEPDNQGGKIVRWKHFQTNIAAERDANLAEATTFLRNVKTGNVLLAGLAYGTDVHALPEDFVREFEALGSTAIRQKDFFSAAWAFAARKGDPSTIVEQFSQNNNGVTLNAFIPDPNNGSVWRAVVPISGTQKGEIIVGAATKPNLRFHAADKLLDGTNQADLIIIMHPKFRAQAERLAQHRRDFSGYTVQVVDIYDIYDEFNDGNKEPVAIRRFLQYADTNWADPKPGFVILFGDASWDAMHRMRQSTMVDYIPSSGVPSTDHIYTVAFGDSTLYPRQFLGRLPVLNEEDARAVVDKIIEYDSQPPARWNKKFVFATGGQKIIERDDLRGVSLGFASLIVGSNLDRNQLHGEAVVISRTGTTDADLRLPSTIDGEAVRDQMNAGALWLDFNGHGATTTLDLNYGLPEDFDNEGLYFILATWSCQTGLFSEPSAALRNEGFVTIPGKGSIASIGGTSFSYTNIDNTIRDHLYGKITSIPNDRNLGEIFMLSKYEMFGAFGYGKFDNNGVRSRNHVMTYNLLGDPSMNIATRSTPELALPPESARLTGNGNNPPDLGDTVVVVRADLWNYGSPVSQIAYDSGVYVTATLLNDKGEEVMKIDSVKKLIRSKSLEFQIPLPQVPGEYLVRLVADPDKTESETFLEDNVLILSFLMRGSQPFPLEPLPYAILPNFDDITIRLLNPLSGPGGEFTLDTVPTFDSPGRITSGGAGKVTETELVTYWNFSIPSELRSASTFWWKAVSTTADPGTAEKFPLIESFTVQPGESNRNVTIAGMRQMGETRLVDLVNQPSGIGPGTREVPVEIIAVGQTRVDSVPDSPDLNVDHLTVRIGEKNYRVDDPVGINVLVLPPNDIVPIADRVFALYDFGFADTVRLEALEEFVNDEIQPGQKVLLASSGASFQVASEYENGRERLSAVLKTLGSTVADSLELEDTYILIGGKGLAPDQVKEVWIPAIPLRRAGEVPPFTGVLFDTITAVPKAGTWASPVFGPATAWRTATFDLDPATESPLAVAVVGVRRDGLRDTVSHATVTPGNPVIALNGVDLLKYPRLEMVGKFFNDTVQRLRSVSLDFDASPELAIVPSSIRMSPDSILQGDPVTVQLTVANLTSWRPAVNTFVSMVSTGESTGSIADSQTVATIPPLDSAKVTLSVNTARIRADRPYVLLVNPNDVPSEPYTHNNRIVPPILRVTGDGIPPGFNIYADNHRLMDGDYVAPTPELEIRVYDNSLLELDSLSTVTLILDNQWITSREGGSFEHLTKGDLRALFRYTPPEPLEDGPHDLLVFVKDASGNGDTSEIITFYVERNLNVRQIVNWPNPFAKETTFTFTITGEVQPESGDITIFTPTGRKIKTITLGPENLNIGFNKVEWDGLDEDVDRLANGVYFYRVRVRAGGETTEVVEKLAVLR